MSFVITGSPGVGKHTITKEISKILQLPIMDINEIAKKFGLLEKNEDTNEVDVSKLEEIIKKEIKQNSLLVGHLAPYVLSSNQVKKVIVLRKNPYDLISVYKERNYSKEKIKDNIGSEALGVIFYDSISKFGKEEVLQIDVTSQDIQKTTKKVLDAINGEIKAEEIDWLNTISEKNDLGEFFAY